MTERTVKFFDFVIIIMCICCYFQDLQGGNTMLNMAHVVSTSVGMCDIDIRPVSSVV